MQREGWCTGWCCLSSSTAYLKNVTTFYNCLLRIALTGTNDPDAMIGETEMGPRQIDLWHVARGTVLSANPAGRWPRVSCLCSPIQRGPSPGGAVLMAGLATGVIVCRLLFQWLVGIVTRDAAYSLVVGVAPAAE